MRKSNKIFVFLFIKILLSSNQFSNEKKEEAYHRRRCLSRTLAQSRRLPRLSDGRKAWITALDRSP